VLSPDPASNKEVNFIKYPIYVGANRGRGQVNPTGDKTNNNLILSTATGQVSNIGTKENGSFEISIKSSTGDVIVQNIPKGLELAVENGKLVTIDQPLTKDPNVGGFGQTETEIVLQSPARIYGYMALCLFITLTQVFLVIKKNNLKKFKVLK